MPQSAALPSFALERLFFRAGALVLPLVATATSIGISIIAGLERGGTPGERLVWICMGVALVLCAHMILALARGQSLAIKAPAALLWICALIGTGYSHGTFFLEAQRHAGDLRAASAEPVQASIKQASSVRSPSAVAAERAKIEERLATLKARRCQGDCPTLLAMRTQAVAQIKALDVEFDEATRDEQRFDAQAVQLDQSRAGADALREDPVTLRIAGVFGTNTTTIDLTIALGFGWLLESTACLGWLLALRPAQRQMNMASLEATVTSPVEVTQPSVVVAPAIAAVSDPAVTSREALQAVELAPVLSAVAEVASSEPVEIRKEEDFVDAIADGAAGACDPDLSRLAAGVARGELRATVVEIRRFFSCSQARALVLRRAFWQTMRDTAAVPAGA